MAQKRSPYFLRNRVIPLQSLHSEYTRKETSIQNQKDKNAKLKDSIRNPKTSEKEAKIAAQLLQHGQQRLEDLQSEMDDLQTIYQLRGVATPNSNRKPASSSSSSVPDVTDSYFDSTQPVTPPPPPNPGAGKINVINRPKMAGPSAASTAANSTKPSTTATPQRGSLIDQARLDVGKPSHIGAVPDVDGGTGLASDTSLSDISAILDPSESSNTSSQYPSFSSSSSSSEMMDYNGADKGKGEEGRDTEDEDEDSMDISGGGLIKSELPGGSSGPGAPPGGAGSGPGAPPGSGSGADEDPPLPREDQDLAGDASKRKKDREKMMKQMREEKEKIEADHDPALINMGEDPQAMTRRFEARRKLAVIDGLDKKEGNKEQTANRFMGDNAGDWRFNGPYDYPTQTKNPGSWQLQEMTAKGGPKSFAKGIRHESLWRSGEPGKRGKFARYKHDKGVWKTMTKRDTNKWISKRKRGYGRKWEENLGTRGLLNKELKEILTGWRTEAAQRQNKRRVPGDGPDNPIVIDAAARNPVNTPTVSTENTPRQQ